MGEVIKLKPARVELPDKTAPYMPRLPWRGIFFATFVVLTLFGSLAYKERRQIAALKSLVLKIRAEKLATAAERFQRIESVADRALAEALARSSQSSWSNERVPELTLRALQESGVGLYGRINLKRGKQLLGEDAIGRCLGLWARDLRFTMKQGDFLSKTWLKRAHDATSLMQVRVLEHELSNRIERDLPWVREALHTPWIMITVEHQATREKGPVDIYIWDIATGRRVLAQRTTPHGEVLSVKIPAAFQPKETSSLKRLDAVVSASSAIDCSIANQLQRALTTNDQSS